MKNEKNLQTFTYETNNYLIHGDVILNLEPLPKDFKTMALKNTRTLQVGNSTGHSHDMIGGKLELRDSIDGVSWLNVTEPTVLMHEEHNPIRLEVGSYRKSVQLEKDHINDIVREVQD